MHFEHSGGIWRDFPQLVPGILFAEGITAGVSRGSRAAKFTAAARSRLAQVSEGELPELQAWLRVFSGGGTQADPVPLRL